jgi:hypothetical protein
LAPRLIVVEDDVGAVAAVEGKGIVTLAAVEHIRTGTAAQYIVAGAAVDLVVARPAIDEIPAIAGTDGVVQRTADEAGWRRRCRGSRCRPGRDVHITETRRKRFRGRRAVDAFLPIVICSSHSYRALILHDLDAISPNIEIANRSDRN